VLRDVFTAGAILLAPLSLASSRSWTMTGISRSLELDLNFIMAADLMVVCILIIVACSGFFVVFTFSFGEWNALNTIAYALFRMLTAGFHHPFAITIHVAR
jgi:hypothetical protein